jgi:type IV secretory pathway component VirB8
MWKSVLRGLRRLPGVRRAPEPPPSAPLNAFERARVEWFERYGCAVVDRNRLYVGWVLTTIALVAACGALMVLMPLKTVEPYVVRVADNGLAIADRVAAQNYRPGRAERTYFVSRWVKKRYFALLIRDRYVVCV